MTKYPVIDDMKECNKCHQIKHVSEYSKPKDRTYSSMCKSCKREYSKKYREDPINKEKSKKYHQDYMLDPENRKRKNEYDRKFRKQRHVKDKKNKNRRDWTAIEKQKAINYKGGKCIVCGYNKCAAALDFHHINPEEKEGYGTGALKAHWTFEKNIPELDKCVLLCVRCHRELHAGVISL